MLTGCSQDVGIVDRGPPRVVAAVAVSLVGTSRFVIPFLAVTCAFSRVLAFCWFLVCAEGRAGSLAFQRCLWS